MSSDPRRRRLRRAAARATRRLRYRAGLLRFSRWAPLPIGLLAAALAAIKVFRLGAEGQLLLLVLTAALALGVLVATLLSLLARSPRWSGSRALDEHHKLDDRLTTSLELGALPAERRSGLVEAAIEDGLSRGDKLAPGRAVPLAVPRELGVSGLLLGLVVAVAWLEIPVVRPIPPPPPTLTAVALTQDDIALFREIGSELGDKVQDPTSLAAVRRFNALIEDLADQRLDRREAFERLADLEAELSAAAEADREAREAALDGLARELKKSSMTRSAAQALEDKRLADAAEAMKKLAERLRRKTAAPSRAELERLRQALQKASQASGERTRALEQRRSELRAERESLLKRHREKGTSAARDPEAQKNARQLERLDRDVDQAKRGQKELSELDRALAEAAAELMKELSQGAQSLEKGAEDLNRLQQKSMTDAEKKELLQRLRELRELLRQQGQSGKDRLEQMRRFAQRARGRPGGEGEGQGKPGLGGPGGKAVGLRSVPVPGQGSGQSSGSQGQRGEGSEASGSGPEGGKGRGPEVRGAPTHLDDAKTHDVTAAGIDTQQGTASAEVIYGAAEKGFLSPAYRNIYVEYQGVAEDALLHDEIPPGYRFYVRRYFQLIRPRE